MADQIVSIRAIATTIAQRMWGGVVLGVVAAAEG
jgi:hypothetical protein